MSKDRSSEVSYLEVYNKMMADLLFCSSEANISWYN